MLGIFVPINILDLCSGTQLIYLEAFRSLEHLSFRLHEFSAEQRKSRANFAPLLGQNPSEYAL